MSLGHCGCATALGALGHTRPLCKAQTGLQRHCDSSIVQLLCETKCRLEARRTRNMIAGSNKATRSPEVGGDQASMADQGADKFCTEYQFVAL